MERVKSGAGCEPAKGPQNMQVQESHAVSGISPGMGSGLNSFRLRERVAEK